MSMTCWRLVDRVLESYVGSRMSRDMRTNAASIPATCQPPECVAQRDAWATGLLCHAPCDPRGNGLEMTAWIDTTASSTPGRLVQQKSSGTLAAFQNSELSPALVPEQVRRSHADERPEPLPAHRTPEPHRLERIGSSDCRTPEPHRKRNTYWSNQTTRRKSTST